MNIENVVKLIKGVCLLILDRPNTTRMERLIAKKVLVEVVGVSGAALPSSRKSRRLGRGGVPLKKDGGR